MEIKIIEKLQKDGKVLTSIVNQNEFTKAAEKAFDCKTDGYSTFTSWGMPTNLPKKYNIGVIYGASGCLGLGTKVLMYNNTFKNIEDVIEGDVLMGPDSTPRNVIKLIRGVGQMYWVRQNKGFDYRVNETHVLSLKNRRGITIRKQINNIRKTINYYPPDENKIINISVKEFIQKSKNFKTIMKGYKSNLIQYKNDNSELTINPYFLGLWLGDGDSNGLTITNIDAEVLGFIKNYSITLNLKCSIKVNENGVSRCLINNGNIGKNKSNNLLNNFKLYNLINNKHIPINYLSSSENNRLELLAGLLDTDGSYHTKKNCFEITQKNSVLSAQIAQLARSLGFYVSNNKSIRKIKSIGFEALYNRIHIFGDLDRIPTKIKRKQAKKSSRKCNWLVTGIKIEKDIVDNFYGFQLDGDNLFLLEDLTVTHNSGKSTLLKNFGSEPNYSWDCNEAIISHFDNPDEAINKLSAVGLNSIPSWYKPYNVLSNGEKFRADLSRSIRDNAIIDEFTSVVDRNVAKAASMALSKYIKNNNIQNVVLATCHEDVLEWLEPDWVINTNTGEVYDGNFIKGQTSISKYIEQSIVSGQCLKTITI